MPDTSWRDATCRVEFDLPALAEDSYHSTDKGRSFMAAPEADIEHLGLGSGVQRNYIGGIEREPPSTVSISGVRRSQRSVLSGLAGSV